MPLAHGLTSSLRGDAYVPRKWMTDRDRCARAASSETTRVSEKRRITLGPAHLVLRAGCPIEAAADSDGAPTVECRCSLKRRGLRHAIPPGRQCHRVTRWGATPVVGRRLTHHTVFVAVVFMSLQVELGRFGCGTYPTLSVARLWAPKIMGA